MKNETEKILQIKTQIDAEYETLKAVLEEPSKTLIALKEEAYKEYKARTDRAEEEYNEIKRDVERPLVKLIEQYYDETLRDKTDMPIRLNDVIANGKKSYRVLARYMHTKEGKFKFNPRVKCEILFTKENKQFEFFPWELTKFSIVEMQDAEMKVSVTGEGGQA